MSEILTAENLDAMFALLSGEDYKEEPYIAYYLDPKLGFKCTKGKYWHKVPFRRVAQQYLANAIDA